MRGAAAAGQRGGNLEALEQGWGADRREKFGGVWWDQQGKSIRLIAVWAGQGLCTATARGEYAVKKWRGEGSEAAVIRGRQ